MAVAELEKKAPKVARLLEENGEEILGVYALPEAHRKRMRTTNMLERQNQELKRRTRVIRVFPHEQSLLRLIAALLMETNQDWMGRIYLQHGGGAGSRRGPGRSRLRGPACSGLRPPQAGPLNQQEQEPTTLRNGILQNI